MHTLKVIIVDDERPGRENLNAILETYLEGIVVVGMAENISQAKALIDDRKPDLIFLDIALGPENGLEFLKSIPNPSFETIFVTAYEEYAVKAFRTSATDYIVKPIDIDSLMEAVDRVRNKLKNKSETIGDIEIRNKEEFINIFTQDGKELILVDDIVYLQSINYYTKLVLIDEREIITSKTLKAYQTH